MSSNFHHDSSVYSKWEKMVEKLNEFFSLVIKCRWKFSSTFWVCWENVDEIFPKHVLQMVKCRWKFSSTLKLKTLNFDRDSFATQNYTLSKTNHYLPACLRYGKSKVFLPWLYLIISSWCKLMTIFSKTALSLKKFAPFSSNLPGRDNIW